MTTKWPRIAARLLLLGALALSSVGLAVEPILALSLNPLDYYEYDYSIVVSHAEVEAEGRFSVTASATVRCVKDLPMGVTEANVRFSVVARSSSSDAEYTLLGGYDFLVSDVPDWAGDEYATTESVDLAFPPGASPGTYAVVARLEHLSLDGWNVTSMVPSSSRTIGLGTIVCSTPEEPPTPPPAPLPGLLTVSLLGHEFTPTIDSDGVLEETVDATLIEGLLSLEMPRGTRCLNADGSPLEYVSATLATSRKPYEGGAVISAFNLFPDGARFSPDIRVGIAYDPAELPPGCEEDDLKFAYYDRSAERWIALPGHVDEEQNVVSADVSHFTAFGLLAPTATSGPARFTVRSLEVAPAEVAPFGRVTAIITVANTGDTRDEYPLVVTVNGKEEHAQGLQIGPRQSTSVRLTIVRSQVGVYTVAVEGLSSSFRVVGSDTPPAPGGATDATSSPGPDSATPTSSDSPEAGGMHPLYVALLALAGVAFLTLVILVLAGVL
jgi:hypothetical protein